MTNLNVQAVVVIVIIKIIIFTKNYVLLCRENQERGTFIFCGLYYPNLAGTHWFQMAKTRQK